MIEAAPGATAEHTLLSVDAAILPVVTIVAIGAVDFSDAHHVFCSRFGNIRNAEV
jgi:hypothetical protein